MATYTDLHNKVKETINVDYHTRDTVQEVHLKNQKNQYWGTFFGSIDTKDLSASGACLSNTVIVDSVLSGSVELPGGIDIIEMKEIQDEHTEQIQEVSSIGRNKIINNISKNVFPYEMEDNAVNNVIDELADGYVVLETNIVDDEVPANIKAKIEAVTRDSVTSKITSFRVELYDNHGIKEFGTKNIFEFTLQGTQQCTSISTGYDNYYFQIYSLDSTYSYTSIGDIKFRLFDVNQPNGRNDFPVYMFNTRDNTDEPYIAVKMPDYPVDYKKLISQNFIMNFKLKHSVLNPGSDERHPSPEYIPEDHDVSTYKMVKIEFVGPEGSRFYYGNQRIQYILIDVNVYSTINVRQLRYDIVAGEKIKKYFLTDMNDSSIENRFVHIAHELSNRYTKAETSSATELSVEFNNISSLISSTCSYAYVKANLSNDGYATEESVDNAIATAFEADEELSAELTGVISTVSATLTASDEYLSNVVKTKISLGDLTAVLSGLTYDFSNNGAIISALCVVVTKLGGTVINFIH